MTRESCLRLRLRAMAKSFTSHDCAGPPANMQTAALGRRAALAAGLRSSAAPRRLLSSASGIGHRPASAWLRSTRPGLQSLPQHAAPARWAAGAPRALSGEATTEDTEKRMAALIEAAMETESVTVTDVSGGCGSAYDVLVVSKQFEGKGRVQQARMVYDVLKEDIASMHAINVKTKVA